MNINSVPVDQFNYTQNYYRIVDAQQPGEKGYGVVDKKDTIIVLEPYGRLQTNDIIRFRNKIFQEDFKDYVLYHTAPLQNTEIDPADLNLDHQFSAQDILMDDSIAFGAPDILMTPEQITEDIDYTIYVLTQAYVGWHFLQPELKQIIATLQELKNQNDILTPAELKQHLENILSQIPDEHFNILFPWNPNNDIDPETSKTPSHTLTPKTAYSVTDETFEVNGTNYRVPIIKIKKMIVEDDEDFASAMQDAVRGSDALVLDLRGNTGGCNNPNSLLKLLTGYKIIAGAAYYYQSPEALAMRVNQFECRRQQGLHVTESSLQHRQDLYRNALKGNVPLWEKTDISVRGKKNYHKPIYVLINERCASNTESTIAILRHLPNVTLIGTHTWGAAHFGGCGMALLPNSNIELYFGTRHAVFEPAFEGDTETFIEQTGFQPHIQTEPGAENADEIAFEELRKYFIQLQATP